MPTCAILNYPYSYGMWLAFVVVTGAVVGSFLNMLVYRLPLGKSLTRPLASACPVCGHLLAAGDNVPVLSWLVLLGRCRYCRTGIHVRYPLIEAVSAILFAAVFWSYYNSGQAFPDFIAPGWKPDFVKFGPVDSWSVLLAHLVVVGAFLGILLIDLQHRLVPAELVLAAGVAVIPGYLYAVLSQPDTIVLMPHLEPEWIGVAIGGFVALVLAEGVRWATGMLGFGRAQDGADTVQRRDADAVQRSGMAVRFSVIKEAWAPLVVLVGGWVGGMFCPSEGWLSQPWSIFGLSEAIGVQMTPLKPMMVIAGVFGGCVLAMLLLWAVRLVGSLIAGVEAVGMGDVYLAGAVGAVLGPKHAVVILLLSPYLALAVWLIVGLGSFAWRRTWVVTPYGPSLVVGAFLVMIFEEPLYRFLGIILPVV